MKRHGVFVCCLLAAGLVLFGCSSAYYAALEKVGIEKREILVDRVEAARDAQQDAQTQFKDALEQFKALVGYDGGKLEAMYESLRATSDASTAKAREVRDRIAAVKDVAEALFKEWGGELQQYSDAGLRRKSQRQLNETRARYARVVAAMDKAAARMDPVLAVLHDQVLFLKHNLNASALGSLEGTSSSLQKDVDTLIADMQAAIAEANRFIGELTAAK
ncbi:MAG: DNA repair protein [Acidobacteria bacterium RBG_13_68_16]|nr:MAG: DNA repair protein [Acidobacteria bacterium RBG_13_68_16]